MLDTLSESLEVLASEPLVPPSPAVAAPPAPAPSSLAPTQPSPLTYPAPGAPASIPPPSTGAPPLEALPTLPEALLQRVRVGQGAGPLWGFALIAVGLALGSMALFSGSCSALLARGTASSPAPSARAQPSAVASTAPPQASAPPPSAPPSEAPAAGLSDGAREAIEARPPRERSVEDVLGLGASTAAKKRRAIGDDAAKASQSELYAGSPELVATLKSAALDPDTWREALGTMAKLPSASGPDLLYWIWTTRKKNDPAAALAEALLASGEVRKRASAALLVALDLRAAESCEAAKDAVTRAAEQGDRRSAALLGRFAQKKGCGDGKRDDCWPCLRDGDELKAATQAVGKRAGPKL